MPGSIQFFNKGTTFKLPSPRKTSNWIHKIAQTEGYGIGELNYIFCSDKFLLGINQQYLDHDTFTDIITFDLSEGDFIEGEIYISIPRVRENSRIQKVSFHDELDRVIIHGLLHLLGYSDKGPRKKALMRKKEDACLALR
ncbi:rRNA maturation RNase YbeY [Chryseolinea sp. T2]|uniref:rRNA maturation RNase YbeY n=1 Tax=Chryseolinea sp. T2 TaxID=3129255 RepID=UPI003076BA6C